MAAFERIAVYTHAKMHIRAGLLNTKNAPQWIQSHEEDAAFLWN